MDVKQYSIEGEGRDEVGRRYFKIAVAGSRTPLTIPADSIVNDPSSSGSRAVQFPQAARQHRPA